jgi:pimeloyl-ACP methyl ester carboxylesterase
MPIRLVTFPSGPWHLNGCVHAPEFEPEQRIGILLVHENTKFGTHGLFKRLADTLAARGFYVLRFDNRGTCDSPGDCDFAFQGRVADACAAAHFFSAEYKLDHLLLWGLCMGAAVSVHCSTQLNGESRLAGMMLCSLLANPVDASLPEFDYKPVTVSAYVRNGMLNGGPWKRLRSFLSDSGYRANVFRALAALRQNRSSVGNAFKDVCLQIGRVGQLLARYDGPTLLVYGSADPYWTGFSQSVNSGDKLRLAKMKFPPKLVVVSEGDHMFNSVDATVEVIQLSVSWAEAFREGKAPTSRPEELHALFATSAAS